MAQPAHFKGFSKHTSDFFAQLPHNNSKKWFDEHRDQYEQYVLEPARSFIEALGDALRILRPQINAIPLVNKSLFRLNRDTRFSKDKTPYKTHLGIWIWGRRGQTHGMPRVLFSPSAALPAAGQRHAPLCQASSAGLPRYGGAQKMGSQAHPGGGPKPVKPGWMWG